MHILCSASTGCTPGTGKVCANCNTKKVWCSYLGAKPSAEIIILSKEECAMLKPKKARTSGVVPKAGQVSVEIGKSTEGSGEILEAIWQQNSLLGELLGYQQQMVIANRMGLAHDELPGPDRPGFGSPKQGVRFGGFSGSGSG
jgi:hypothetical protein